jgi:predicted Zn-dependent protease
MNGYRDAAPSQRLMQILIALVMGAVAVGFFAIKGCQSGPFGRKQIVEINDEQQVALGAQAYEEVLTKARGDIINRGPVYRAVDEVTQRLVKATKNPDFLKAVKIPERRYAWEVNVIRSREVNAFCLPGGKMVVFTGILPVCETDAGLATVMGHEISHALGQHGAERMAQAKLAQIGIIATGAGLGGMDSRDRATVLSVLNAGAQYGILAYGRTHESEADHVGLLLMATAGYNPEEAAKFWERMQAKSGGRRQPEFLSTHPSHETRIRDLIKWTPEAMPFYRASGYTERPRRLPSVE